MQDDAQTEGGREIGREPPTSVSPRAVELFLQRLLAPGAGWEGAVDQLRALLPSSTFVRDVPSSPGFAGGELWSVDTGTGFCLHLLVRRGVVRDVLTGVLAGHRRDLEADDQSQELGDPSVVDVQEDDGD